MSSAAMARTQRHEFINGMIDEAVATSVQGTNDDDPSGQALPDANREQLDFAAVKHLVGAAYWFVTQPVVASWLSLLFQDSPINSEGWTMRMAGAVFWHSRQCQSLEDREGADYPCLAPAGLDASHPVKIGLSVLDKEAQDFGPEYLALKNSGAITTL